jgi:hypothetical protein
LWGPIIRVNYDINCQNKFCVTKKMCFWKLCCVTFRNHMTLFVDIVFATWCIVVWWIGTSALQQCALVSWQDRLGMYSCSEESAASSMMVGDGGSRFLLNTSTYLDCSTLKTEKTSCSEMAHTHLSARHHRRETHQSHSVPVSRFFKYLNSHVGFVYCLAHFYIFF